MCVCACVTKVYVTKTTRASPVPKVPRLPRRSHVDVAKYHTCHAKGRPMPPSATPATQRATATTAANQPSAVSATPATQSEGQCGQVPRLPCKRKVNVTKRHACHATCRGDNGGKRDPAAQSQPSAVRAMPATQSEGRCRQVPRELRKMQGDVAKRRACHPK